MRHPDALIRSVELYQERKKQESELKVQKLANAMKTDSSRYVSASPIFGSRSAKTYLYVFADFQCPFCAQVSGVLSKFIASTPDVALVYKNYPIVSIHPEAMNAAAAAWAAQQQSAFWPYHDILYANQSEINDALLITAAKELKLDLERFNRDRKSEAALASIKSDMELGNALGISGTPFFVMNGEVFSGAVNAESLRSRL
ncbi:thioredoxin domain-containing protein [Synechococcus sp. HK05]|uniref:DsbA family protein n=1 Tax=Synechococcus sp. HK05 TaxID=2725975 RepID=UPI001C38C8CC|nr:thioredoxin domain-containing protein [Synechococcus sp. HK05]MBV2350818.1 thioredoxin domain-containing protein [Synechococcus sp. HK05]